ncbi:MAG: VWA domain-containing protein [Symploca sp. SIO2E6]|nr:VWA domain-containing protein [Symploca sp. SIO2E6]
MNFPSQQRMKTSAISASPRPRISASVFYLLTLTCLLPLPSLATPRIEISPRRPENGLVNLRVKVLNEDNVPIEGLKKEDFQIYTAKTNSGDSKPQPISQFILLKPEQLSKPDPGRIVILLDMSGSMAENDASGVKKLDGAIAGIRNFIEWVRQAKIPAQIALVPFGEATKPECAYDVTQSIIEKRLLDATDPKLDEQVNQLAGSSPCAATNLYDPVAEAVEFLGNSPNTLEPASNLTTAEEVPPRLTVILFSDGYHTRNRRFSEKKDFADLSKVLQQNPEVRVNTLGYGESLEKLRDRASNCPFRDEQLSEVGAVDLIRRQCRLPGGADITRFIVDSPRLRQIAKLTSGISEFPSSAEETVMSLETFFKTLREYEIQYRQPGAEPADKYKAIVEVNSPSRQLKIASDPTTVTIPNFVYHRLRLFPDRFLILLGTLVALGVTVWGFSNWSYKLKQDAERWI